VNARPAVFVVALTLLSATSCTSHKTPNPDTPEDRNIAHVANKYHISPGGITIPPPEDVAGREKKSCTTDDKTLVLMADIATAQDMLQSHLNKVDEQVSAFVQPVAENTRQIAELKHSRLPELEKKIDAVQKKLEAADARLESRITALEQHFVSPTHDSTPPPPSPTGEAPAAAPAKVSVPAIVSNPAPVAKAPAAEPTASAMLEKFLAEPKFSKKPVAKYSQFAQELRDNVRETYTKVLDTYPNSTAALDAYLGLGGMAEQDDNWNEAARCYREALERFPNVAQADQVRFGLATALEELGEFDEARKQFLSLADLFPRYQKTSLALIKAADCLQKSGKPAEALKEYKTIEHAHQNTPIARLASERIGDVLFALKNFKEAVTAYASACSGNDEIPEVLMKLAKSQVASGEFSGARENLRKLLGPGRSEETRASAYFAIAFTFEEEGDFLNAARAYASGADSFPIHPNALDSRMKCAQLFLTLEMPDHALAQCDQLLLALKNTPYKTRADLEPQALHTAVRGSRLVSNLEKLQTRLAQLRREWPDSPQAEAAELDEADFLEQAGKSTEAIAALRELVRQRPNTAVAAQAILKIADIQERSKNAKRGISLYGELAALTADADRAARLKLRRALLMEEAGKHDEALALLTEVTGDSKASQSASGMADYQMALIEQKRGRLVEAIGNYEKLIARSKDLTGDQLGDLLEDARWKVSKLKWLSNLQKQQELIVQPDSGKPPQPAEKRS
jgi:tetratricopeptide (TPR) repeat protein